MTEPTWVETRLADVAYAWREHGVRMAVLAPLWFPWLLIGVACWAVFSLVQEVVSILEDLWP